MTNLEKWRYYNDSLESPDIFINWTWFLTIAASLQRRVCLFGPPNVDHPTSQIYPNQFVVFIGPSGVGKTSAARGAKQLFKDLAVSRTMPNKEVQIVEPIKTGPSSVTVQQLYRYMALNLTSTDLSQVQPTPLAKGKVYIHGSLAFFCGGELGSLIEKDSEGLVTFLTDAWDCDEFHRETKTQGIDIIPRLCVTLLGAATPGWIQEATKARLLKQGFAARTLFMYAEHKRKLTHRYEYNAQQMAAYAEVREHIRKLTVLYGELKMDADAEEFVKNWYEGGGAKPINTDKRLADYYERKKVHLYKLAIAIHFSERLDLVITLEDVKTALAILTESELFMHRALSFGGENPIYIIAQEALRILDAANGTGVGFNKLLLQLFDMGDAEEVRAAMTYLVDTEQVTQKAGVKGMIYERKNKS